MTTERDAPEVVVNGTARVVRAGMSIGELVADLGLAGKRIAVEKNGDIVPRSAYADTVVRGGDRLEIVVAVGGG